VVRHRAPVKTLIVCLALTSALAFAQNVQTKTTVTYPSGFAVSRALSEMPIDEIASQSGVLPVRPTRPGPLPGAPVIEDPALQKEVLPNVGAIKGVDFDGVGAAGFAPSDSDMAVGPNHILEGVNVRLAVFSKTGTLLAGPTNFTTFFAALGAPCGQGASDPIMLYDRMADRWLVSDVGIGGTFAQCVGISKTNDPTGAYFLYSFSFGATLNDYPKLGVWPTASNSAYLATYNLFPPIGAGSADLCGMDRTKMLAGSPNPAQLCQKTPSTEFSYLPSDMDGPTPPTDGTPGLFLTWQFANPGQLFLRKLTMNFTAGTSTLSAATVIPVANFTQACNSCVPQLGTPQLLDTLGDRPMNRFPVRHFPDHDRAILTHAVASGAQVAMRWYELFDPAGAVAVNQQGTFAPDTTFRWMGSMAEDKLGDIAIGYSASSTAIHPAIRFTGRVPSDPAGTLETEASIIEGAGSQTSGLSRWGDYTALVVDPNDDCTFWYVNQYEKVNGSFNWSTHIGSFAFNTCTGAPAPAVTLSATKLSFPKTVIGATSIPKSVTLTNSGNATLHISSITASGDFAISNNTCGATVAAGASCAVSVTFTPTNKGTRKGNLTFTDDAPTSPQIVALVGAGTAIKLTPTSLLFGTVTVGQTSPSQTVTVTNVATFVVTFTSFTFGGVAPGDYLITNNTCGASLAGGASCAVSVAFKPTVKGKRNATLKVADNGGGSPQTAMLKGTGA
jgi:centrosomal CEP192-like protein